MYGTSCLAAPELLAMAIGDECEDDARRHLSACPTCVERLRRLREEVATLRRAYGRMMELHSNASRRGIRGIRVDPAR